MTAHELNIILQIACVTLLALAGVLLLKHAKSGLNTWTGISLVVAVICYLILETSFVHDRKALFLIAVTGAMCIPVIFFLLTKAIFDDHFKPSFLIALWFALNCGSFLGLLQGRCHNSSLGSTTILYIIRNRFNRFCPSWHLHCD